jgi:hypothetical protein
MSFIDSGNANTPSWNSPLPNDAQTPAVPSQNYGGMFGLGPLDWKQKLGLVLSAVGDAANNARGFASNSFGNALANLRDANARRALAATPFAGDATAYATRLQGLGVPLDVALRMAAGFRSLQGARTLSPAEAATKGFRQGTVVEEQPGGEDRVVQQSDVKSPEAVAQEFAIARGMPVTQAQQDKFDIQRGRFGLPPLRLPQQPLPSTAPTGGQTTSVPIVTSVDDALKLPRGSYFRTPDGQLRQVP